MRTARVVGPTADGTSMVLVTEDGEEITVPVDPGDPAVRSAWPSVATTIPSAAPSSAPPARRPPRRRETHSMDTPLSPRDIQTRIRSGESLEDVVAGSGMAPERVERFAAPVLAEREHMALTALGSSVRRRGESSGHRPLRAVVAERLLGQGVDADDVAWDAWKRDDNHWQVIADYELRGEPRHAEFHYDPQGRFSLAEDDDARWLAGERPSPVTAAVDRDDELALVRATREPSDDRPDESAARDEAVGETGDPRVDAPSDAADVDAAVLQVAEELGAVLQVVPPAELSEEELAELATNDPEADGAAGAAATGDADELHEPHEPDEPEASESLAAEQDDVQPVVSAVRDEAAEPTVAVVRHLTSVTVEVETVGQDDATDPSEAAALQEARSALDTLYDMLGGDGYAEESTRVYAGLSDAAAVPVVDVHEFEPPADVLVPAEPGPEESDAGSGEPAEQALVQTRVVTERREAPERQEETEPAAAAEAREDDARPAAAEAPPVSDVPEPLIPSPGASRTPGRRKRASVPSWDEIMFGGPKPG